MYQKREKQVSLYENSICFAMGGLLDPQNRWVKLSGMIPWDQIEEKYILAFDNPIKGSPAKSCRMAIGSLIAFNEAGDLQGICERYKDRTGHYPERILGDKIYRNRTNLQYCEKHNIRMNGPKLGRPPKDPALYTQQKRMERQESGDRNVVEGKFGEGKRFYGLGRVMTRLQGTSEVAIHMTFLVMNLQKRLRDLLLSIFRWLIIGKMPTCMAY